MAMSPEQMTAMLQQLQASQNVAVEKLQTQQQQYQLQQAQNLQQQQQAQQTAMMDAMKQLITESKQQPQPSPPSSDQTEKQKALNQDRKSDIKLNEKSDKRIKRLSGGDDEWEELIYDFASITRS